MNRLILAVFLCLSMGSAVAQSGVDTLHHQKVYVVSGMGWGFAIGETYDILNAKFSNTLGLDFSLPNRHYFVYPSIDFLTFSYNQQVHDPDYPYDLEKGRSNFYVLNLAGGIRKQLGKLNVYTFIGPGAGLVSEPRADVRSAENRVKIENTVSLTPTLRWGGGADYKVGGFFLFIETGWLHNFRNIQGRSVNVISLYGGLKTDVTRLKDNVVKVMGM